MAQAREAGDSRLNCDAHPCES